MKQQRVIHKRISKPTLYMLKSNNLGIYKKYQGITYIIGGWIYFIPHVMSKELQYFFNTYL